MGRVAWRRDRTRDPVRVHDVHAQLRQPPDHLGLAAADGPGERRCGRSSGAGSSAGRHGACSSSCSQASSACAERPLHVGQLARDAAHLHEVRGDGGVGHGQLQLGLAQAQARQLGVDACRSGDDTRPWRASCGLSRAPAMPAPRTREPGADRERRPAPPAGACRPPGPARRHRSAGGTGPDGARPDGAWPAAMGAPLRLRLHGPAARRPPSRQAR